VGLPIAGATIYITELFLIGILGLLVVELFSRGKIELQYSVIGVIVGAFILWGLASLLRGTGPMLGRLRDFATNYYSVFFLLVAILCVRFADVKKAALAIAVGTAIAAVVIGFRIASATASVTSTGALRYHSSIGIGATFVLFSLLGMPAPSLRRKVIQIGLAMLCAFGIIVATQHRSAALALAASGAAWVTFLHRGRAPGSIGSPSRLILIGVAVMAAIALLGTVGAATYSRLFESSPTTGDYNALWRLYLWKQLFQGFLGSPVVGHGFGANLPLFMFRGELYGDDPVVGVGSHNSYLFVLYKEGLIGLSFLILFSGLVFLRIRKGLRETKSVEGRWLASAFGAAFIFVAMYACFNVVLEGPYMGMFFWTYPALAEAALNRADARQLQMGL